MSHTQHEAHDGDASYRGHSLLNACLPNWRRRLLLTTVDLWSTHAVLRGIEWPGGEAGKVPGNGWALTTDVGSVHHGAAGTFSFSADGYRAWEYTFTPGMPERARTLEVAIGADAGERLAVGLAPLRRHAHDELVPVGAAPGNDQPCFGCAAVPRSTPRCPSCSSVDRAVADALDARPSGLPSALVPLGVDLGRYGGIRRVVCGVELWRSSFDLLLEARGAQRSDGASPLLGGTWSLRDDRGNQYVGVAKAGGSFRSDSVRVVCTPELDAKASVVSCTFLDPFGAGVELGTAVALEEGQRRTPLAACGGR